MFNLEKQGFPSSPEEENMENVNRTPFRRIIEGSEKKIKTEIERSEFLSEEEKNIRFDLLETVLSDEEFLKERAKKGNWEEVLATTNDPEVAEENFSKGLVIVIKEQMKRMMN